MLNASLASGTAVSRIGLETIGGSLQVGKATLHGAQRVIGCLFLLLQIEVIVIRRIPASDSYPGLIAHDLGDGREIVVIGSGEEVERVLEDAVTRVLDNAVRVLERDS